MNTQFEIYREGKLDRIALYKKQALPAFIRATERFDAIMAELTEYINNAPQTASRIAQAVSHELDRQAGR